MKKILSMLGYEEKVYGWDDLDLSIKKECYKRFGLSILLLISSIVLFVTTKSFSNLAVSLLITLIYFLTTVNYLLLFYYKKFVLIIGECIDVSKPNIAVPIFKTNVLGKSKMTITANGNYVVVPITFASNYDIGSKIAVYAVEKNIYQTEEKLFKIVSPSAISTISRKQAYTKTNTEK